MTVADMTEFDMTEFDPDGIQGTMAYLSVSHGVDAVDYLIRYLPWWVATLATSHAPSEFDERETLTFCLNGEQNYCVTFEVIHKWLVAHYRAAEAEFEENENKK